MIEKEKLNSDYCFCPKCGKKHKINCTELNYCRNCGGKFDDRIKELKTNPNFLFKSKIFMIKKESQLYLKFNEVLNGIDYVSNKQDLKKKENGIALIASSFLYSHNSSHDNHLMQNHYMTVLSLMKRYILKNNLPKFFQKEILKIPYCQKGSKDFGLHKKGKAKHEGLIYKYKCNVSGCYYDKIYIGVSVNFKQRLWQHITNSLNPESDNYNIKIHKAIRSAFLKENIDPNILWNQLYSSYRTKEYKNLKRKILKIFRSYFETEILEYHIYYNISG